MTQRCDLIVRDATVFDGTGAPHFRGDVGVTLSFRAIPEFGGRVLRVAHRSDGDDVLVITAFFDRGARL